jgi:hypothetical protein
MASLTLADHAGPDHHDAGLPNSAGLPDLGPRAKGSHGSPDTPDTPTPSTPKRDTKRRRVARFIAPVPWLLGSVPQGPEGPKGPEGPRGPRRRMDLRVTIPWNPWNGTIAHRDHMPRPESGIDDTPRDLADVGIVGIAPGLPGLAGPSRAFDFAGLAGLPDPSGLPALPSRPRVRAQKTLCNHPTQGHLFDFPTHEPSWPSLMAPHATDEFLGPQFLGPQFLGPQFLGPQLLGQLFREFDPMDAMGPMAAMGPWDCEDPGKYSRKELETLVPSATMVSAAMTVRMATSPDFLFCDESPLGPLAPGGPMRSLYPGPYLFAR